MIPPRPCSSFLFGVAVLACLQVGGCRPGDHPPDAPASAVADWLVDKLYVEVRQDQAVEGAVGRAREQIAAELLAVASLRGGEAATASRVSQVYRERIAARDTGAGSASFVYRLTFKAGGMGPGMQIEKELTLGTVEQAPGVHRVSSLLERDLPVKGASR